MWSTNFGRTRNYQYLIWLAIAIRDSPKQLGGKSTMGIAGGARAMRLPAALAVPRYNQGYRTLKEYLE